MNTSPRSLRELRSTIKVHVSGTCQGGASVTAHMRASASSTDRIQLKIESRTSDWCRPMCMNSSSSCQEATWWFYFHSDGRYQMMLRFRHGSVVSHDNNDVSMSKKEDVANGGKCRSSEDVSTSVSWLANDSSEDVSASFSAATSGVIKLRFWKGVLESPSKFNKMSSRSMSIMCWNAHQNSIRWRPDPCPSPQLPMSLKQIYRYFFATHFEYFFY